MRNSRDYTHPSILINESTQAQGDEGTCLRSHRSLVVEYSLICLLLLPILTSMI